MKEQFNWGAKFMNLINQILGANIRAQVIDGEPWFAAKDVCDALNIENYRDAVARLDVDEKRSINVADIHFAFIVETPKCGNPNMTFVNESGVGALILKSRKPEAGMYKRRFIHETIDLHHEYSSFAVEEENAIIAAAKA